MLLVQDSEYVTQSRLPLDFLIVFIIIPTGFIQFLFKMFDCIIDDDAFSNIGSSVFYTGWGCHLKNHCFKTNIYQNICKSMVYYIWYCHCNPCRSVYHWDKTIFVD